MRFLFFFVFIISINIQAQWKPKGDKIKTVWGESLDPSNVLNEYPRPILKRKQWKNLNGLWNFKITSKGEHAANTPAYSLYLLLKHLHPSSITY